jgi:hypothetical protein
MRKPRLWVGSDLRNELCRPIRKFCMAKNGVRRKNVIFIDIFTCSVYSERQYFRILKYDICPETSAYSSVACRTE